MTLQPWELSGGKRRERIRNCGALCQGRLLYTAGLVQCEWAVDRSHCPEKRFLTCCLKRLVLIFLRLLNWVDHLNTQVNFEAFVCCVELLHIFRYSSDSFHSISKRAKRKSKACATSADVEREGYQPQDVRMLNGLMSEDWFYPCWWLLRFSFRCSGITF